MSKISAQLRRKIVHEAAEEIATDKSSYTCMAIMRAYNYSDKEKKLSEQYAEFYDKETYSVWFDQWDMIIEDLETYKNNKKNHRLMLLAFFAEVGLKGVQK